MDPLEKSLSPQLDSTVLWVAHQVHAGVTFSTILKLRRKRSLHSKSIAQKSRFFRLMLTKITLEIKASFILTLVFPRRTKLWTHWQPQFHSKLTIEQFQPGRDKVIQDIQRIQQNLCSNPDCWACQDATQETRPASLSFNSTWSQILGAASGKKKKKNSPVMDGPVAQVGGKMNSNHRPPLGLLSMGYFLKHLLPCYPSSYEWRSRQEEWRCQL